MVFCPAFCGNYCLCLCKKTVLKCPLPNSTPRYYYLSISLLPPKKGKTFSKNTLCKDTGLSMKELKELIELESLAIQEEEKRQASR